VFPSPSELRLAAESLSSSDLEDFGTNVNKSNEPQLRRHRDSSLTNSFRTMISRSAIGRNAQLALRRQCCAKPAPSSRRGLAAVSTGSTSFSYETADVGGVKVASRDVAGPTTSLAVVAKAGTRYQPLPGLTVGLEQFAFKVCILPQGTNSSSYTRN
jgi:hypothetical protein